MTTLDLEHTPAAPQTEDRELRQWVFGALAAIVLAAGGWWMNSVEERFESDRARDVAFELRQRALEQRLEVIVVGIKEGSDRLESQLKRQDEKLDRITAALIGGNGNGRRFDK